ncbi:ABC transporter ATP-binding protein [Candidatus Bathyarchaeota archaeon]|nr:ABC transporter ATP-binding protein [Candidatus Bathyarchaeota archaeon]
MVRHMELLNVTKVYPSRSMETHVLRDITFNIHEGEFLCIVGPTGCGKSTLLKIIAGLEKPTSGLVKFQGEAVVEPHPKISMVFQSFALFPWRTVLQNIEFGLEVQGIPKKERREIAMEFVEMVNLKGYEHSYPKHLSGGMKQRVGIARALATDPEIVLMDEAFSAIDEFTAHTLRREVTEIWLKTKKTFVLVTHNLEEAIELADRILVLTSTPGRVKSLVNVTLRRPRRRGTSNFLKVHRQIFRLLKEELEHSLGHHHLTLHRPTLHHVGHSNYFSF